MRPAAVKSLLLSIIKRVVAAPSAFPLHPGQGFSQEAESPTQNLQNVFTKKTFASLGNVDDTKIQQVGAEGIIN